MAMGLGPDTYAIIEQGRIGQILNSKPMDRRAIIEEAAGITMYKTKQRLAETKLEASKMNLSRVNDILVEVEKQLASLKRQASKARRYAEIREQMRASAAPVLAGKPAQLDAEAERLELLIGDLAAREESGCSLAARARSRTGTPERTRVYELDAGCAQANQTPRPGRPRTATAPENRIAFQRTSKARRSKPARSACPSKWGKRENQKSDVDRPRPWPRGIGKSPRAKQATALENDLNAKSAERAAGGATEQSDLEQAHREELTPHFRAADGGRSRAQPLPRSLQAEEAAARATSAGIPSQPDSARARSRRRAPFRTRQLPPRDSTATKPPNAPGN